MIDLTIKTLDSRNHSFSVADDITVKQLKEQIAESVNVPADSQRLIYCGRVLQDDKNLSEYYVNGKVIHLVQRPPPAPQGSSSSERDRDSSQSGGGGSQSRGAHAFRRRRLLPLMDGGDAMYLGAMAIPTDFMESQGLTTISQPRHLLAQSRISLARRMLLQASSVLDRLENPSSSSSTENSQQPSPTAEQASPPPETNASDSANGESVSMPGSIAVAAQVATAAAIAAAVSAAHNTNVQMPDLSPVVVAVDGDQQETEEASIADGAAVASNVQSQSTAAAASDAAEDVDATISSTTADDPGQPSQSSSASNEESQNVGNRNRIVRVAAMSRLMDTLASVNRRLQPFMERYHQAMRDDPVLESPEETQRIFTRVSEVMHFLSHAYHAMSDIMCDFSQPPPRVLRCRPVLIQHSAVVQTGIPIQAQINVTANNSLLRQLQAQQQNSGSQTQSRDAQSASTTTTTTTSETASNSASTAAPATSSVSSTTSAERGSAAATTNAGVQVFGRPNPLVWVGRDHGWWPPSVSMSSSAAAAAASLPSGVPGSGLSGAENNSASQPQENRQANSNANANAQAGGGSGGGQGLPIRQINVMGPGNFEFFMDVNPGSITIDSLEATVVTNNNPHTSEVNVLGGIPWGSQPPADIIQSLMQALTSQLVGGATAGGGATSGNTSAANAATTNSSAATTSTQPSQQNATATANSQARGNTATHPTTSTQTRSTARPHVHFAPSMQGLGTSSFDPFLPCNSHHIPVRPRRRQQQQQQQQRAANASSSSAEARARSSSTAAGSEQTTSAAAAASSQQSTAASAGTGGGSQPAAATVGGLQSPPSGGSAISTHEMLLSLSMFVLENLNRRFSAYSEQPAASTASDSPSAPTAAAPPRTDSTPNPRPPFLEISSNSLPISQLIPLLAGAGPLAGGVFGGSNPLQSFMNFSGSSTIASLLPNMTPDSILGELLFALAENLTFVDVMNLTFGNQTIGLLRARPSLQRIVSQRLLNDQPFSVNSSRQAVETFNQELRPVLDSALRETTLREDIDLVATISQLNHRQLRRILAIIMEGVNYQSALLIECFRYFRYLCAIIQYCCVDQAQGMESIIRRIAQNLTAGVPGASSTISSFWSFLVSNIGMNEEIHSLIVYRRPDVQRPQTEQHSCTEQPMEVEQESTTARTVAFTAPQPAAQSIPTIPNTPQVEVVPESLPDVLIGSEDWHSSLPTDWVPIITRDSQRQRRQSSQPPFSDAYLSGMPSKRRKIITASKPQGSLSQVISENMQTAVSLAGVVNGSGGVESTTVVQGASGDSTLRLAYRDEVRASVRRSLQSHPDYSPDKYPNAAKYFDAAK